MAAVEMRAVRLGCFGVPGLFWLAVDAGNVAVGGGVALASSDRVVVYGL
jgi:hypothetical protein